MLMRPLWRHCNDNFIISTVPSDGLALLGATPFAGKVTMARRISIWKVDQHFPDNKVHGANVGPIWGRQDPGGPHVGPMNLAI